MGETTDEFDIPDTSTRGLSLPTASALPGRVLALEVQTTNVIAAIRSQRTIATRLGVAIVGASLGVIVSVISAAAYVGGELRSLRYIEQRIERLEDRAHASYHRSEE